MSRQVDLVFLCDTTGSMGSYLQSAKDNINKIVETVVKSEKTDLRFALVEYKDHPPQDQTFPFRLSDFMTSLKEMKEALNQMYASGGGDGPESVACGLKCCADLDYREYAAKIIVWIADAPPHGLGCSGDGFSDGCPCGVDFIQEVQKCMDNDIAIYTVSVEPTVGMYDFLRELMRSTATKTRGQYCALSSADALGDLIIAGVIEEVGVVDIVKEIETKLDADSEFKTLSGEEQEKRMKEEIEKLSQNRTVRRTQLDSVYEGELPTVPEIFFTAKSLKEIKEAVKKQTPPKYNLKASADPWGFGYGGFGMGFGGRKRGRASAKKVGLYDDEDDGSTHIKMEFCDVKNDDDFAGFVHKNLGVEDESNYYILGSLWKDNLNDVKNGLKKTVVVKETTIDDEYRLKIEERVRKGLKK
ncbi:VWFA domain-containing protein [Entamoeba marina]